MTLNVRGVPYNMLQLNVNNLFFIYVYNIGINSFLPSCRSYRANFMYPIYPDNPFPFFIRPPRRNRYECSVQNDGSEG